MNHDPKLATAAFATIADFHHALSGLVEQGFGDLPAQLLVVPDTTLQSIAGAQPKPALMLDIPLDPPTGRLDPSIISVDGLEVARRSMEKP